LREVGDEAEFPNERERAKKVENGRREDVGIFALMLEMSARLTQVALSRRSRLMSDEVKVCGVGEAKTVGVGEAKVGG